MERRSNHCIMISSGIEHMVCFTASFKTAQLIPQQIGNWILWRSSKQPGSMVQYCLSIFDKKIKIIKKKTIKTGAHKTQNYFSLPTCIFILTSVLQVHFCRLPFYKYCSQVINPAGTHLAEKRLVTLYSAGWLNIFHHDGSKKSSYSSVIM